MCGIAGTFGDINQNKKAHICHNMIEALAHRGPDGNKNYSDSKVTLIHTRLSIIDLSANGNQPLYNEDKSLVLICNGEIYNYISLRNKLIAKGHQFSSASDCEVILHLYEEYSEHPEKLLKELSGMFAFALWDIKKQQILLARDRIGIKPLYYSYKDNILGFASEVRPLANSGLLEPTIDYTSAYEYFLNGTIPAPNTLYNEIKSLDAGHYLIATEQKLSIKEYWDIPQNLIKWRNNDEIEQAVESLLDIVVKDHLVADVPVGTFLSAGVDSSLITVKAVKHHPGIQSFTATFPGEPEDEGFIAENTAQILGTSHHNYSITGKFFDKFNEQFGPIDQPFGIASALSLGRISRLAANHVKVVLSGDGGDELFGGYHRHASPARPAFLKAIPSPFQNSILKLAATLTGKESLNKLRETLQLKESVIFQERTATSLPHSALSFLHPDVHANVDTSRYLRRLADLFSKCTSTDALNRVLYVDMKTTLIDEMLTKCDRFTMINGVEGRVPLLDHRMVELAFSIPGHAKRTDTNGKIPLRNILSRHLGKSLAYREKTGFNSPLKQWLKNDADTKQFAETAIDSAKKILFLNPKQLSLFTEMPDALRATEVFSLVCAGKYFENQTQKLVSEPTGTLNT